MLPEDDHIQYYFYLRNNLGNFVSPNLLSTALFVHSIFFRFDSKKYKKDYFPKDIIKNLLPR